MDGELLKGSLKSRLTEEAGNHCFCLHIFERRLLLPLSYFVANILIRVTIYSSTQSTKVALHSRLDTSVKY
jgi:hypothetical protein